MDEVEALEAIFGNDLEVVNVRPLVIFVVNLISSNSIDKEEKKKEGDEISFRLTFELPEKYPDVQPNVSVASSKLNREKSEQFSLELDRLARSLVGNPMLFELITWSKDNISSFCFPAAVLTLRSSPRGDDKVSRDNSPSPTELLLIEIDHMRDERNYVKTIRGWADELDLSGRLLFCDRGGRRSRIYLLLQGNPDRLKSYERRHMSENVDVDSKGRACKERMMKVVCKIKLGEDGRGFRDFQVVRIGCSQDLRELFCLHGIDSVFDQYIEC